MDDLSDLQQNAHQASAFLKTLANEKRLLILCSLMDSELSVKEINQQVDLSQSALSQHLAWLREADLVSTRKQAQTVYYRVTDDRVKELLHTLKSIFCSV